MPKTKVPQKEKWIPVVFASECIYEKWDTEHEFPTCPNCRKDYAECPCPGPTQDDLYDYKEVDGMMYAKKKEGAE